MFALGADLCGIASIDRFANAPKGYHPLDVFPACLQILLERYAYSEIGGTFILI